MTRLHVLGAGTPTPTAERFGTAHALELSDGRILMFDCGPGATGKLVRQGFSPVAVSDLFFTHHHFDHNADYGCFLMCRWDQAAVDPHGLSVWGPSPTRSTTHKLIGPDGVFAPDWNARVGHPLSQQVWLNRGGSLPRRPPQVRVTDVGPGTIQRSDLYTVTAARAVHVQPFLDSLAYRVDTPDGAVVFTGDTEPCASVVDLARGAAVLVAMCWDRQPRMVERGEARGQSGTEAAALMAAEAGVDHLVLAHIGPALASQDELEVGRDEVSRIFPGRVTFSHEGTVVDLSGPT